MTLQPQKRSSRLRFIIPIQTAALILLVISPVIISLTDIWKGMIPFWYDPARDFLLALDHLNKPRLIGQETGIPGVFYGPFWIWFLSLGLLISKDPRFVATVVLTVPYFTLFPCVLYQLTKSYGKLVFLILWFLFIFSFRNYSTYLWNPHLAPLILLLNIYLLVQLPRKLEAKRDFSDSCFCWIHQWTFIPYASLFRDRVFCCFTCVHFCSDLFAFDF